MKKNSIIGLVGLLGVIFGVILAMFINVYGLKIVNIERGMDGEMVEAQVLCFKNCYYVEYEDEIQ